MRVAVAGTFSILHRGHRVLLEKAFEIGKEIVVGLTSDEMVKHKKAEPFEIRKKNLKNYLDILMKKYGKKYKIIKIDDPYSVAAEDAELDAIVVSEETKFRAEEINKIRIKRGLKPLKIFVVKLVLAEDGKKISSTRIKMGEIDSEGRILKKDKFK